MNTCCIAGIVREDDGDGCTVCFPDVSAVRASGTTQEEAIFYGTDGLRPALRDMVEKGREVPVPRSMEATGERVRAERVLDGLTFPGDTLFQYIPAPDLDPVRGNISLPRGVLREIDGRAKLAGMTGSGHIAAASLACQSDKCDRRPQSHEARRLIPRRRRAFGIGRQKE